MIARSSAPGPVQTCGIAVFSVATRANYIERLLAHSVSLDERWREVRLTQDRWSGSEDLARSTPNVVLVVHQSNTSSHAGLDHPSLLVFLLPRPGLPTDSGLTH